MYEKTDKDNARTNSLQRPKHDGHNRVNARSYRDAEQPQKGETQTEYRFRVIYIGKGARDQHEGGEGKRVG